jgi:hypothetical protein
MKCFALDKFCIVRLLCFFVIKSRFCHFAYLVFVFDTGA